MSKDYQKVPSNTKGEYNKEEKCGWGVRHVQAVLIFLSLGMLSVTKSFYVVTVVAMTHAPTLATLPSTNLLMPNAYSNNHSYPADQLRNSETLNGTRWQINEETTIYRTFNWTKSVQETILNSFNLGLAIMHIPMGLVGQRWGPKVPLQIACLVSGLVSLPVPWLAAWGGWQAMSVCRIAQGMSMAGMFPTIQIFLTAWIPPGERGRVNNFIYTGLPLGGVAGYQMAGFLASSNWGWPSVYWVTGVISLMMFVIITLFAVEAPADHKTISDEEKRYILFNVHTYKKLSRSRVPWRAMYTSKYVLSCLFTQVGLGLFAAICFFQIPPYIHHALGVDIKNSGVLSSLPFFTSIFACIMFGYMCDYLINRNIFSVQSIRRLSNTTAAAGAVVCLVLVTFTRSVTLAVALFVMAGCTHAAAHTGWMLSYIDIAPNYSGVLMAVNNCIHLLTTLVFSVFISNVLSDMKNLMQWRIIFLISAGIVAVSNLVYCTVLTTEEQPWNRCEGDDEKRGRKVSLISVEDKKIQQF